jgi:hypothetical protein
MPGKITAAPLIELFSIASYREQRLIGVIECKGCRLGAKPYAAGCMKKIARI